MQRERRLKGRSQFEKKKGKRKKKWGCNVEWRLDGAKSENKKGKKKKEA